MPRPKGADLQNLFGPHAVPPGWEQRVDQMMFFVSGVRQVCRQHGIQAHHQHISQVRGGLHAARTKSAWETALPSKLWGVIGNDNQVKRCLSSKNVTFPTAANMILAVEHLPAVNNAGTDIYALVHVVPQFSFVHGLTPQHWKSWSDEIAKRHTSTLRSYLAQKTAQPREEVFDDMRRGHLVSEKLAQSVLAAAMSDLKGFQGRVSSNFDERAEIIKQQRHEWRLSASNARRTSAECPYTKKVTGSRYEVFLL